MSPIHIKATKPAAAFQGIPGAYSDLAARRYFAGNCSTLPEETFAAIFAAVKSGVASHGIIPTENSITGSIHQNYDLLTKEDLKIVGEVYLKISHHLMAKKALGKTAADQLKTITTAYSHPQALLQCEQFFAHHPWIKPTAAEDTAGSARLASRQTSTTIAAIASLEAAKLYNLRVLAQNIQSNQHNYTRFFIVSQVTPVRSPSKASLILSLKHMPGSLYQALKPLAQAKINLTKIESRPIIGKPWEYLFYIDIEIPKNRAKYEQAIKKMSRFCNYVKIIGEYQKANHV